nr:hypothetical protein [Mesorhizobium sp.]
MAIHLAEKGYKVVVVERAQVRWGARGRLQLRTLTIIGGMKARPFSYPRRKALASPPRRLSGRQSEFASGRRHEHCERLVSSTHIEQRNTWLNVSWPGAPCLSDMIWPISVRFHRRIRRMRDRKLGRVQMLRNKLEEFARRELTRDDHVVMRRPAMLRGVAEVLSPYVDRIVIANPRQVHMIAHAKVKTDTTDATVLAKLYASGFLPEVWVPDPGGPLPSEDRSPGGLSWFASVRG